MTLKPRHFSTSANTLFAFHSNSTAMGKTESKPKPADLDRFVYPWTGILSNLPTQPDPTTDRRIGVSGSRWREQLAAFHPVRVTPVWTDSGHTGFAFVDFGTGWTGFANAMAFDRHFARLGFGKRRGEGEVVCGWMAREEDWTGEWVVGAVMRRNREVMTVEALEEGVRRRRGLLRARLESEIEERENGVEILKAKYGENRVRLEETMCKSKERMEMYHQDLQKLQRYASNHSRTIIEDNERLKLELENKRSQLDILVAENSAKRTASDNDQLMNKLAALEIATSEHRKLDEDIMEILKVQQREKEAAHQKILYLEKQVDAKQMLELEVEKLKGNIQVVSHMESAEDGGSMMKVSKLTEELQEKLEELEAQEALNEALVIKEKLTKDELEDARKELISVLSKMVKSRNSSIGIKTMGELDVKPFQHACKEKFGTKDHLEKAKEYHSLLQEQIKNVEWRPYKPEIVQGTVKEVVDEDDEKLLKLKADLGNEVYRAVCTALLEINGPSGKHAMQEVWNFRSGRKATNFEGLEFLLLQLERAWRK